MENIKDHKNLKLVTDQEKYAKHVMKPNCKDGYPFSKAFFQQRWEKPRSK